MIDVPGGFLRPPDESGGYRMLDGITCVRDFSAPRIHQGPGGFSDMMSGSMLDVMRGSSGPPDKSGGYRMLDGITCVRDFSAFPRINQGR